MVALPATIARWLSVDTVLAVSILIVEIYSCRLPKLKQTSRTKVSTSRASCLARFIELAIIVTKDGNELQVYRVEQLKLQVFD